MNEDERTNAMVYEIKAVENPVYLDLGEKKNISGDIGYSYVILDQEMV